MGDKSELVLAIKAQAEEATSSVRKLNTEFKNAKLNIKSVQNTFNNCTINMGRTKEASDKLSSSFSTLGKKLIGLLGIRTIINYLYKAMGASVDYTETLNLFTTALGNNIDKGTEFQNQLNEIFGTNKEELMKSQGLYTAIATSLGLASDQAYTLGENLTKLSLDLSSLYNKDIEKVNEALKSGLVGQTKAVRQLGMDITEKTLNAELLNMGITDKTTAVMSQTEKVILRYIVMLKQSTLAQGDFAKTIESPANQLRILKQQIAEITKWIGNIFYGTLKNILPYINAFAMAIKEVIKSIALIFGYTESNFGGALFAEDLDEDLTSANTSAKKLKNTLQSFDEIHNIDTGTDDDTSSIGAGIDSRLLSAMSDYNNAMENVKMKAITIRDKIMDWLGFTKQVDEKTGEVSFKLKDGFSNLKLIGILLGGTILAKIALIISKLASLSTTSKTISKIASTLKVSNIELTVLITALAGTAVEVWKNYDASKQYAEALWNIRNNSNLTTEEINKYKSTIEKSNSAMTETRNIASILTGPIGFLGTSISELKGRIDGAKEAQKNMNKVLADSIFFNSDNISITNYSKLIQEYMDKITSGIPSLEQYNNEIENSKTNYNEANASFEILIAKMETNAFKATSEDIDELNSSMNSMIDATEAESLSFENATISIINNLKKQGYVSSETADIVIKSAIEKAKAEKNNSEIARLEIQKLDKQLKENKITQEEYAKKVQDVYDKYLNLNDGLDVTKTKLKELGTNIQINGENWNTVNDKLKEIKDTYNSSTDTIKTNTKTSNDYLYTLLSSYKEGSKEYTATTDAIKGNNKRQTDSIKELEKSYALSLYNVLTNLATSGELMTDEGKKTADNIINEFNNMGYKIDTTKSLEEVKKQIEGVKPEIKITADASGVKNALNNAVNSSDLSFKSTAFGRVITDLWNSTTMSIKSILGVLGIKTKAEGGFVGTGQMFIAREAGPELVGKIGSHTAVANNSQIVNAVSQGVAQAVASVMKTSNSNQAINIWLGDELVTDRVIKNINTQTQQYGTSPLL